MKKGFTLIELMIVVVIIGILAAIAIPNFVKIIEKAKNASVQANMHTVQVTVETMAVDHEGNYPGGTDSIEVELPDNFSNPYGGTDALIDGDTSAVGEGEVCYDDDGTAGDFDASTYTIGGGGKDGTPLDLILSPGQ